MDCILIMPVITVQVTPKITREQKEQVVREMTQTMVTVLGKKPEQTHIIIQEIEEENWGYTGILVEDYRANERKNQ